MKLRERYEFISRDITQTILNVLKRGGEKIRPTLGNDIHITRLRELVVGSMLFSSGMASYLYASGKRIGEATANYLTLCPELSKAITAMPKSKSSAEFKNNKMTKLLINMMDSLKLGKLSVVGFGQDEVVFRLDKCAQCYRTPKIGEPVCYHIAGYLAGIIETVFKREVRVAETKCCGLGDDRCEFSLNFLGAGK